MQDQIQQQHDFQVEEIISAPRETKQQQSFSTTEQLESTAASEGEDDQSEEGDNPWLKNSGNKAVKKSIKQQSAKVSRHEKALEKLSKNRKNVLQDNAGKRKREDEESTQLLELGANGNLAFTSNSGNKSTKKPKADAEMQKGVESNNEDIEDEESNIGSSSSSLLVHKKDVKNLSKMDIMQLAFGDDGVMEEFEQEKQEIIEEDAPKEVDLTLPGWVSFVYSFA